MGDIAEASELLPSPWTSYTQPPPPIPRRNPFRYARSMSTTSSPISSPDSSPTSSSRRNHCSASLNRMYHRSRSGSPFTMRSATSSFRLSSLLLRRRPSAVDLALSEERYRCAEDSVEKIGLGLMEPRPVDPIPAPMIIGDAEANFNWNMNMSIRPLSDVESDGDNTQHVNSLRIGIKPRFVMGGIFEVMEGSA
ncbi:conserved hypothetical protein [Histoplasma capsulatum var. duboisii H88]|uniref:Uncharacterized protein n=4 Tax=Ajellomyces capsulatus TaxID=5037 RepID=C0NKC6_AJECG|nr:uncharacterized protein HCBG_03606 [Histoplasma capsulatum G186AR]EER39606.1 conserved hypothetical protein [Histoplasma capsulatum H143]EGC43349.1 conserved hypothetical protein [Histoplasma capsulatum var. duboisii H88]KAG5299371.1 hypothetical protein I7I52_09664 [Histoplasma capsulatum]EEH08317.1 conserved hypothetical protein [Histoplasma capsulatum G186AR]QSS49531.1 hypothetical protein I7I53_09914 [Histoplasma capsulatum var. duboisii H88]